MSSPRVNGSMLAAHIGKNVRIVGRIENIDVNTGAIVISSSDNQHVTSHPHEYSAEEFLNLKQGSIVEFVCSPQAGNVVQRYHVTDFGANFDLDLHEQIVRLTNDKHRDIFLP